MSAVIPRRSPLENTSRDVMLDMRSHREERGAFAMRRIPVIPSC